MQWWLRDKTQFESFQQELLSFPSLKYKIDNNQIIVEGNWFVYGDEFLIAEYQIQIVIPENYPNDVPKVYEVGNLIVRVPDNHINYDGSVCLFAPPQRWEKWPLNSGIDILINGPIKEYFFSQAYFAKTGEWPFGEWAHGDDGTLQYYFERLKINSLSQLKEFHKLSKYSIPSRQWKCPCGSKRYKTCHWIQMKTLIDILPNSEWSSLQKILDSKNLQ